MYSVAITNIAEEDIMDTVSYIANVLKAPTAANNLLDEIERHEEILQNNPNICPYVPDDYLAQRGLKFTRIKNYLLFYIMEEDERIVTVIRFLYARRDWKNILKTP
jgi:plasmid stabilization system protein ParE